MTRRSNEQITDALNFVHASDSRDASAEWEALDVLAAEVRAQREELAEAREYLARLFLVHAPQCEPGETLITVCTQIDSAMVEIERGRATIARVEALAETWARTAKDYRSDASGGFAPVTAKADVFEDCSAELHDALRGGE